MHKIDLCAYFIIITLLFLRPLNDRNKYMNASVCFEQKGIIESINHHLIRIRIDRETSCAHCNASGICNIADMSERTIEISNFSHSFSVGEWVGITITRKTGNMAVLLGYFIPFILLIATLLILTSFTLPEWQAGLISLLVLVPYFAVLYLFREKLKKTFSFSIHKIG